MQINSLNEVIRWEGNMKQRVIPKIILLTVSSMMCVLFFYQCHTASSTEQKEEGVDGKIQLRNLNDVKEGTLARAVAGTGMYEILPQLETSIEINIEGMVSSTTVDQVFTNSSNDPVEAVYVFPLPHNAAVYDMTMIIDDRLIQGVIMERKSAVETYEKAKAEGKRASLTEQERPNIFTHSVANIMPGDTITVRLQYVEKLVYEEGVFRMRFPMVVAPRYIPGSDIRGYTGSGWAYDTDIVPDASRITPPVVPPDKRSGNLMSLTVNLNAGLPLSSISSVSHDVHIIQVDEGAHRIELKQKKTIPNKDFILEYQIKHGNEPRAALFTATRDKEEYFFLMAVPPVNEEYIRSVNKEIIFVLDISGSMSGTSIEQARSGLINALSLLDRRDRFNIIAFNDRYEVFAPFSVEASTANIMNGINYVTGLNAGGGTEAQPALKHAMTMARRTDELPMIIFVTDGSVGNEDQLISLVNNNIGESRLFTVGIGSAPNGFLLEKVSHYGRGTFTSISDSDEVQTKIDGLFSKIESPVLMDLRLNISEGAEIYPFPIPDLFAGQPLTVFGKTGNLNSDDMILAGRTGAGEFIVDLPFNIDTATDEPAIPSLWARSKISGLMDEYRLGSIEVKQEIIDLALEHKLMTQFTSFVAVEQKIVNPEAQSRLDVIPSELPAGWDYEKVSGDKYSVHMAYLPQTASTAPLIALTGLVLITAGAVMARIRTRLQNAGRGRTRQS
jgi:Ca-activated chloride channel family protein